MNFLLKNRVFIRLLVYLLPIIIIGLLPLPPLLKFLILLITGGSTYFYIKYRTNNSKIQNTSNKNKTIIEGSYRFKDDEK